MERFDILSAENGDLLVSDNDLVFGASDTQHIQDTINAAPGWWKEHFTDGVNIFTYLNSSGQEQVLCRSVKIQLESDLYTVVNPTAQYSSDSKLILNPGATI